MRVVLLSDHERQKLPTEPSIAMLTAKRSPKALYEFRNFGSNHTKELAMLFLLEVQDGTQMQFPRTRMRIVNR